METFLDLLERVSKVWQLCLGHCSIPAKYYVDLHLLKDGFMERRRVIWNFKGIYTCFVNVLLASDIYFDFIAFFYGAYHCV